MPTSGRISATAAAMLPIQSVYTIYYTILYK